jgi:hypothetical protein
MVGALVILPRNPASVDKDWFETFAQSNLKVNTLKFE